MYHEINELESVYREQLATYDTWRHIEGSYEEMWAQLRVAVESLIEKKAESDLGQCLWISDNDDRKVRPMPLEILTTGVSSIKRYVDQRSLKGKRGWLFFSEEKR